LVRIEETKVKGVEKTAKFEASLKAKDSILVTYDEGTGGFSVFK